MLYLKNRAEATDRRRRVEPLSRFPQSRRLSYSLVYSIVTKRLHKERARWKRKRVHRQRMVERAVTFVARIAMRWGW